MIHLKDINKTYDNGTKLHVLKGVSLDINDLEKYADLKYGNY